MIGSRFSLAGPWPRLLAVSIVCLLPSSLLAESLIFVNKSPIPLTVHTSGVVAGRLFRNRPYFVRPGESTPPIARLGDMVITVCDGRIANRILFRQSLRAGLDRQVYDMFVDPLTGLVRLVRRVVPAMLGP